MNTTDNHTADVQPVETFETRWKAAFDEFKECSFEFRAALRQGAVNQLKNSGAEEIGSSDVNHQLYSDYNLNGKDWQAVMIYYVNNQ